MAKIDGQMLAILQAAVLLATGVFTGAAFSQKQSVPAPPSRQAIVTKQELQEDEVKQLLLLMDTDKNGKISKKEWMDFMSKEFDRLDKDKSGELDPKELAGSRVRPSTFPSVGK